MCALNEIVNFHLNVQRDVQMNDGDNFSAILLTCGRDTQQKMLNASCSVVYGGDVRKFQRTSM